MDLDELTVQSRWSSASVYRLVGCTQLYFEPPRVMDDALWGVIADGLASLPDLTHWIGPLDNRKRKLGNLDAVRAALSAGWDADPDPDGAVTLRAFATPDPPREQLTLSLPRPDSRSSSDPQGMFVLGERPSNMPAEPDAVLARVIKAATVLRPHAGTVGFGLMSEPWMEPHHAESAWPYLQRYPGLNLPYRLARGADGAGIAGVDWLTVLGDSVLELVGGVETLQGRLTWAAGSLSTAGGPEASEVPTAAVEQSSAEPVAAAELGRTAVPEVIEYPGGVIVRASALPMLAQPGTGAAPQPYRVVDTALRPWRWDGRSSKPSELLNLGKVKGWDSAEATLQWASRFE